jgi:hypothetical protein
MCWWLWRTMKQMTEFVYLWKVSARYANLRNRTVSHKRREELKGCSTKITEFLCVVWTLEPKLCLVDSPRTSVCSNSVVQLLPISWKRALKVLECNGLDFVKSTIFTPSSNAVFRAFVIFLQQENKMCNAVVISTLGCIGFDMCNKPTPFPHHRLCTSVLTSTQSFQLSPLSVMYESVGLKISFPVVWTGKGFT